MNKQEFASRYINRRFYNISAIEKNDSSNKSNFSKIIKFLLKEKKPKWPNIINTKTPILKKLDELTPVITFINHSTFLIEIDNEKILIDPVFSNIVGPKNLLGVKRKRPPGLSIYELPKIDLILITHNHYDHLDIKSLRIITRKFAPKIIVPLGNKNWLNKLNFNDIIEMDWGQCIKIYGLKIYFLPAQHHSGRGVLDHNKTLWGSFMICHKTINLFHAGDTGYAEHFKSIGKIFDIDLALLPIGDYKPFWFEYMHMNPYDAVRAHLDLKSKQSFAMHHDTFPLSSVNYLEPEIDLAKALIKYNIKNNAFNILKTGESYRYKIS
ncbi:MBL fold metallo-hydrolase [Rickettsia endosymbiont of Cardiosporidium cionae]|uniref:MBL fold metallo-hydrolase n=1 Tax=Rickettsia endosymbiont of Cardiosporidium cionae TaxID=2777155 RepID=UPI001892E3A7|nr:MBL fold metallo-hydrolase [Rickettsia endosymbiont of Cardiosporidium cionae]KAF8818896.1 hypothetical protein IHI24_000130 [Rickettsia endosymbiont of Cardiosporidium cionae]